MKKSNNGQAGLSLKDHLAKLSKGELVELIIRISDEHPEVERRLAIRFVEAGSGEAIKQYKALMRESIKSYSDRHGFVPYRNVFGAISGAMEVMEAANEAKERGNHLAAAEIAVCVMHEMSKLMNKCDDSGGSVGGMIKESLELLLSQAQSSEDMDDKTRGSLFQLLMKESKHKDWEGWDEWRLSLLESASLLMGGAKERELWTKVMDDWEASWEKNEFGGRFAAEKTAELRYSVILRFDGAARAREYLEENLEVQSFRDMAIEDALTSQQYDRALKLIEQGEALERQRGYRGLVHHWEEKRIRLYELTGRQDSLIELAKKFMLDGEYAYYVKLKELTASGEWEANHEALLDEIQSNTKGNWQAESMYKKILIQENLSGRLLEVMRKQPMLISNYYQHLVGDYLDDVLDLFEEQIKKECKQATNRNEYKKVCRIIRTLIEAGGRDRAAQAASELRALYPRRPALLEELDKIKGLK
ncbi:MAG: hypothetical protein K0Q63_3553 [Paenibacillus sp.]|nr:hypothetical protein [Paenibacillus sp.]